MAGIRTPGTKPHHAHTPSLKVKNKKKESDEETLRNVEREIAKPRIAESARRAVPFDASQGTPVSEPSVARCAHHDIEGPGVRNEFQRIIGAWVDPELIGRRIAEGLSAEQTKFFQHEGEVTDPPQRDCLGRAARLLRAGCNLRGSAKSFWKTSDGFLNRPSERIERGKRLMISKLQRYRNRSGAC